MRLIDADSTKKLAQEHLTDPYHIISACAVIDKAETVDAVPVVRCRECKHYKEFRTRKNKQIMRLCYRMGKHDMEYPVRPDDFCSYGERSTNTSTEK